MRSEEQVLHQFARDFPKGTVLFREGDPGREMYVLQAGRVAISKRVRAVEKTLVTLGPGEFFGEMALISSKPRSATATVAEDARMLVIDPRTFETMIRGNAEVAVRMIKKLADRIFEADAQIENLMHRGEESRVVHYLAHAAESRGRPTPHGTRLAISVEELATTTGVQTSVVADVLQKLGRAGLCTQAPDGYVVPALRKLREHLDLLVSKER